MSTESPSSESGLSGRRRAILAALARAIAPAAFESPAEGAALVSAITLRIDLLPAEQRRAIGTALDLLGGRLGGLLLAGRPSPIATEDAEATTARFDALLHSTRALPRTVSQGVRRLVLATWYTLPVAHRSIGYLGPLHLRAPVWAWEGPVAGDGPRPDEPVARVSAADRAAHVAARAARAASARERPAPSAPADASRLVADAIVIGTGAGGGVAAARLAEAGLDVLVLEEGSAWAREELVEDEGVMTPRLYAEGGARATTDLGVQLLQGSALGGGTTVNWMIMLRTPDHVLDEWARRFGTIALGPAALAPEFARVERETCARTVPDDAHSPNNRLLLDGAAALGWSARAAVINADGCLRAGTCGFGCRWGAKRGTVEVYLPQAMARGARVFADARVERLEVVERDAAAAGASRTRGGSPPRKRVHVTRLDRETRRPVGAFVVEAPVVVLAAGAVGTPVLLQRSGLGGGGVGRWLRLHPTTAVMGDFGRPFYGAAGIPLSAVCDEFLVRGDDAYGFWLECPPLHPALGAVGMPGFGAAHREGMRRFPEIASTIALVRDGGDPEVSNGSVRARRDGTVRIDYRLGAHDARTLAAAIAAAARLQLAAGAREVRTLHTRPVIVRHEGDLAAIAARPVGANQVTLFSAHVNGTCRLGTDPRTSGATPDGERHGVRGLWIADGSLLPTAPGVNPQETIMALASVVARRIVEARP